MATAPEEDRSRSGMSMPEAGVSFLTTFVVALVVGFLLVVAGMPTLGAVLFAVAVISVIAMVVRPSPKALAEREAAKAREDGELAEEHEDEEDEDEDRAGAKEERPLPTAPPAPTTAAPSVPAPPPEPPPLEDIVVESSEEGPGEGTDADEEDVVVEL